MCYFRVFQWDGYYYALALSGIFYRSRNGLTDFEWGPTLFTKNMRHSAVKLNGSTLYVFYSNIFDSPERILLATIELTVDWMSWKESEAITVIEPEMDSDPVTSEIGLPLLLPLPIRARNIQIKFALSLLISACVVG